VIIVVAQVRAWVSTTMTGDIIVNHRPIFTHAQTQALLAYHQAQSAGVETGRRLVIVATWVENAVDPRCEKKVSSGQCGAPDTCECAVCARNICGKHFASLEGTVDYLGQPYDYCVDCAWLKEDEREALLMIRVLLDRF
jgi:hypothetical protein